MSKSLDLFLKTHPNVNPDGVEVFYVMLEEIHAAKMKKTVNKNIIGL
ncbi:unnamed protein product [marine sediment metagenome]|uniref:Uncharacterized protein n=1 Tax=marine sediment metagenome TaxID=412755 RepID=X1PJA3_9ZZZZ